MKHNLHTFTALLLAPLAAIVARAGDLDFSDPANMPAPPAHAIGFPSRDANFDALPGFRNPPPGYGEVAFYWWLGDPLCKERLAWQVEQLAKAKGVMGLQINYAHGYRDGGLSFGLTCPSDPPLFSPAWWKLVGWFLAEARQHGMAISLSDYTLGIGQGWSVDEVLKEHPDLTGSVLQQQARDVAAGEVEWPVPAATLMVGARDAAAGVWTDLRGRVAGGVLKWRAPARQRLVAVFAQAVHPSLDPMNPKSGPLYAQKFFGQFEDRHPGEGGKGLNFFFSDELGFHVQGNLWTAGFAAEFHRRKGYDLVPELPALFMDVGPRTPKVRLDYRDVMVRLTEEGFFKPVFDWHQQRGMIYGCDHGGRGRNVVEFGDYFRTQRWNQGPGCDQPGLSRDLIKNKVASSIAHLYLRPRVWLEGYHSSGWGTSSAGLTDATFANFAEGQNLLTLHGLYYSTHGGFWEWAPPCNHFRMPYWAHMDRFLACVQRLSYLLSQGHHRCDVAVLYPVAPMEAGLGGKESVDAAFEAGRRLYAEGIDFDFMDFESLARARIADRQLRVSGERYRTLVLPAMRAVRWSTLQKAVEFQRAGGLAIVLGALPEASDRAGRGDAELDALVAELTTRVAKPDQIAALLERTGPRDFAVLAPVQKPVSFMHRRIGPRDVFMIHNVPQDSECWFRAAGRVELWDPWTGRTRPLPVLARAAEGTRLRLPLTEHDAQLIVFGPGRPLLADVPFSGAPRSTIPLEGDWEFELQPTLDNRFGDYRWPPTRALIGAERASSATPTRSGRIPAGRRRISTTRSGRATHSFGPKFWKLGPLPDTAALDDRLGGLAKIDPAVPIVFDGRKYPWQPYEFSWRWGVEGDPGPQGYHGLKERISDNFLVLGAKARRQNTGDYDYAAEAGGSRYYLWTTAVSEGEATAVVRAGGNAPAAAFLNGKPLGADGTTVALKAGANPLLLRYDRVGRGYFVLQSPPKSIPPPPPGSLAMSWFRRSGVVPFDVRPHETKPAGWYRFTAPPGLRSMTFVARGEVQAWVDGKAVSGQRGAKGWRFQLADPAVTAAKVALRIEQERGCYGGEALPEPIQLDCVAGRMPLGDWSKAGVLECYSGGAWYRKTVALTPEQAGGRLSLDLGNLVSSAEVRVNGQFAGIRVAPPWRVDISKQVKPGGNRIEVLVYNTLANHYLTIPTRYRGELTSGLLGPVTLLVTPTGDR